jgi:hypothetical protein
MKVWSRHIPGLPKAKQVMPVSHLPLPPQTGIFRYAQPYFRCSGRLNVTDGEMD